MAKGTHTTYRKTVPTKPNAQTAKKTRTLSQDVVKYTRERERERERLEMKNEINGIFEASRMIKTLIGANTPAIIERRVNPIKQLKCSRRETNLIGS